MLRCILTGHGEFAVGLQNALEMIAGPQENLSIIPFHEAESLEVFQGRIESAIQEITNEKANLIILTDLMGGTPFNTAMLYSNGLNNVRVLAGTNLPMLLESVGEMLADNSLQDGADALINAGKSGVVIGQLNRGTTVEQEDGI